MGMARACRGDTHLSFYRPPLPRLVISAVAHVLEEKAPPRLPAILALSEERVRFRGARGELGRGPRGR